MAFLVYSAGALADLDALRDFLVSSDPPAAEATAELMARALRILTEHPYIGRAVENDQRELVISRGSTGYVALYRYLPELDKVVVVTIRHQRESGSDD